MLPDHSIDAQTPPRFRREVCGNFRFGSGAGDPLQPVQVVGLQKPESYRLEFGIVEEPGVIHGDHHQAEYGLLKVVSDKELLPAVESGPGYGKRRERDVVALRAERGDCLAWRQASNAAPF